MLSNRMNFSYCVIWNGFPKSSHIIISMLSWTYKIFDCGLKFGGALLKDFVAAFVILILEGLKVRFLYFTLARLVVL